jgi:Prophage CP4-57 regulatory protein (AlpA)
MTVLLRFGDLVSRGVVSSWPQLKRLQQLHGFPLGRMLSPNTRAWTEAEIDEWISTRPIENVQPLRGGAKARVEQARAKAEKAAASRAKAEKTAAL